MSESALADFCSNAGVGSETAVSVGLPDGSNVSGTIQCEAEDLVVGDVDDESADDVLDSGDDDDDQQSDDDESAGADDGSSEGSDDSEDGDD